MGDARIYASLAIQLNSMVSGDLLFDQLQEHLFVMTQSMVRAIKSLPQKTWKHLRSRQAADGSRGGRETACIAKPVLGSSCVPVWLTGMGTGLLQKLEEAWEKSCYPKLWPVCVYVSLSQSDCISSDGGMWTAGYKRLLYWHEDKQETANSWVPLCWAGTVWTTVCISIWAEECEPSGFTNNVICLGFAKD